VLTKPTNTTVDDCRNMGQTSFTPVAADRHACYTMPSGHCIQFIGGSWCSSITCKADERAA